jgi:electron-transferring-flavoprotein dehydrogenase
MAENKGYNKVSVLVVGAGPGGLAAAITVKKLKPDIDVCVIEKGAEPGNHNLSGAVLEADALHKLLDMAMPDWRNSEQAKQILARKVEVDDILFMTPDKFAFKINPMIELGKLLHLGFGQMVHKGDYVVSISKLTKWLADIAGQTGIEVMTGFAVEDILLEPSGKATDVKLVDQGRDKEGHPLPNFLQGEIINADIIILAEGCDGLVTEKFITKAGLRRRTSQLYSVGVKEIIKIKPEQYQKFGDNRVIHAMGYPLWIPFAGPNMFGGGIMYSCGDNLVSLGMIVGLDWQYCDFNPQDALTHFKNHKHIKQFIDGGSIVAAGAKMIPEGGFFAVPRDPMTGAVGKSNVLIVGDSAGFVNMNKIKGLHNAIESGMIAAKAVTATLNNPEGTALRYTQMLDSSSVDKEMRSAQNFRQTVAKFGPTIGFPLSAVSNLLPKFKTEPDYEVMTAKRYKYKGNKEFDKDTFTAMAATQHREEQPSHLSILDSDICRTKCTPNFNSPCITFCPAGVYECIHDVVKPANPSNCLHCKTCQRKCPFDNIRWTVPEGSGGPRYKIM